MVNIFVFLYGNIQYNKPVSLLIYCFTIGKLAIINWNSFKIKLGVNLG